MTAQEWYEKGNECRKNADWANAIRCYNEAIALDENSPAVHAKQLLDDILNFYHKDAMNP